MGTQANFSRGSCKITCKVSKLARGIVLCRLYFPIYKTGDQHRSPLHGIISHVLFSEGFSR